MNLKIRNRFVHEELAYWLEHGRTALKLWRIRLRLAAFWLEERLPFPLGLPLRMML